MVTYMDNYREVKSPNHTEYGRYDEELLCANWNPAVKLVAMSCYQNPQELSPMLPDNLTDVDVRAFMNRISALASQI